MVAMVFASMVEVLPVLLVTLTLEEVDLMTPSLTVLYNSFKKQK